MTWQHDSTDNAYTWMTDGARCRVWSLGGLWHAIVSLSDDAVTAYNFERVEDAQQWCEARVKERRVGT